MAAAEMNASATIRNSEDVCVTVSGEIFDGSVYALVAIATDYCTARCRSVVAGGREKREMRVVVGGGSLDARRVRHCSQRTWHRRACINIPRVPGAVVRATADLISRSENVAC